jgi:sortase A
MRDKRPVDELSIEELERILALRKREEREKRLRRMREAGRVIEPVTPPASPRQPARPNGERPADAAPISREASDAPAPANGGVRHENPRSLADLDALLGAAQPSAAPADPPASAPLATPDQAETVPDLSDGWPASANFEDDALLAEAPPGGPSGRRWADRALLLVEVGAVAGLILLGVNMFTAIDGLQRETAAAQRQLNQDRLALIPTPAPTSILQVRLEDFLLPGGHVVDASTGGYSFNYAELEQYVPANLRDTLRAQVAQSIEIRRPALTGEDAERLIIDKLRIDQLIVPGADDEALKQGVGRVLNGALPGAPTGNVVLAAHNDVYGELFADLPTLEPGDRFFVQTRTRDYEYEVIGHRIVAPDEVYVMDDQGYASVTLITCYPPGVNDKRYVIFARRLDAQGF